MEGNSRLRKRMEDSCVADAVIKKEEEDEGAMSDPDYFLNEGRQTVADSEDEEEAEKKIKVPSPPKSGKGKAEAKREKDREWKRRSRTKISDEKRAEVNAKRAEQLRSKRALMTDEERAKHSAQRMANRKKQRALMTEEERAEVNAKHAADVRRRRALKREKEGVEVKPKVAKSGGEDKPKVPGTRKVGQRTYRPKKMESVTEAEKEAILENERKRYRESVIKRMATETEAEKQVRIERKREIRKQRLSKMTPEELEERRQRRNEYARNYQNLEKQKEKTKIYLEKCRKSGKKRKPARKESSLDRARKQKRLKEVNKIMEATSLPRDDALRLLFATNPELFTPILRKRLGLPEVGEAVPRPSIQLSTEKGPPKQKSHENELFFCEHCGTVFRLKSSLQIHINKAHLSLASNCNLCEMSFQTEAALREHKVTYHNLKLDPAEAGGKSELCQYCGKVVFRNMDGHLLKYHSNDVQQGTTQPLSSEERRKKIKAEYRKRNRERRNALRREQDNRKRELLLGVRSDAEPENCAICNATFSTGQKLAWHILVDHYEEIQFNVELDGDDNLKCYFCGESKAETHLYRLHVVLEHSQDLLMFVRFQIDNGNLIKVPQVVKSNSLEESENLDLEARIQPIQDVQHQESSLPKTRKYQKVVEVKAKTPIQEVSVADYIEDDDEPCVSSQDDHFEDSLCSPSADYFEDGYEEMHTSGPLSPVESPAVPEIPKKTDLKSFQQSKPSLKKPSRVEMEDLKKYPDADGEFPKAKVRRVDESSRITEEVAQAEDCQKKPSAVDKSEVSGNKNHHICAYCKMTFMEKDDLSTHIRNDHPSMVNKCELCGEEFDSAARFWRHKLIVHQSLSQNTEYLEKAINTPCGRRRIYRKTEEDKFICEYCSAVYKSRKSLLLHTRKMHMARTEITECDICYKTFKSAKSLWKHKVKIHKLNLEPFQDELEEKQDEPEEFVQRYQPQSSPRISAATEMPESGLNLNQTGNNSNQDLSPSSVPPPPKVTPPVSEGKGESAKATGLKYPCPDTKCGKSYPNYLALLQHYVQTHAKNRVMNYHPCKICGNIFHSYKGLWKHKKDFHSDTNADGNTKKSNNCLCELCGMEFKRSSALEKHVQNCNFGEKYTCDLCPGKFSSRSKLELWRHKVEEHKLDLDPSDFGVKAKGEICPHCGDLFFVPMHFHIRTRHPDKFELFNSQQQSSLNRQAMRCDVCSKIFYTKSRLFNHKIEDHNLNLQPSEVGLDAELCPYCEGKDRKYFEISGLPLHVKLAHPEKFRDFNITTRQIRQPRSRASKEKNQIKKKKKVRRPQLADRREPLTEYDIEYCKICNKPFDAKYARYFLDEHMKTAHPETVIGDGPDPRVECALCNQKFWIDKQLTLHLFAKHKNINFNLDPDDDDNLTCRFCRESQPEADMYKLHIVHAHSQDFFGFVRDEMTNGNIIPEEAKKRVRKRKIDGEIKTKSGSTTTLEHITRSMRKSGKVITRKPPSLSRKDKKILENFPEIDSNFPIIRLQRVDIAKATVESEVVLKREIADKAEEVA